MKRAGRRTLARLLETWYAAAKRDMPWRTNPTPYGCWLSEIMLQQTTFASALPYYERFLARFPTVEVLAAANEADVLKAWEGLGYYARARNLRKAARQICSHAVGMPPRRLWPTSAKEWAALPGVGPYTAAALASVLNGERVPVVDGNVARVFSRVWELEDDFHQQPARVRLAARLQPEIDRAQVPGDFNQAMMELGALVCTPLNQNCGDCPLAAICGAHKKGTESHYPTKSVKKALPVRRRSVVIVRDDAGRVLLVQNREGGLLKGLWDLPTIEEAGEQTQVFSHFRQEDTFYRATVASTFQDPEKVPLTTAARKILQF